MRIARPFGSVNAGLAGQQTPVAQAEPCLGSCLATTADPSSRHGPSIPRALDRLFDPVDRAADGIASRAMRSAIDRAYCSIVSGPRLGLVPRRCQPASSSPRRSATVSARTRPNSASNAPKSSSRGSPRAAREAADDANTGSSSSRIPRSRGRIVSRSPASRGSRISVKHHSPSSRRLASWAPLRPRARSPMPPGVAPRVAKISPSFGPIWVKSLGGSGIGSLALSNGDGLLADANGGVPRDPDRVLHALVRGAALRMDFERAPGRLAGLPRHPEIVVDVDGFDPDGLADARDPTGDSGGESLAVEGDLAPCQGATQGAVHSTRDGGD